MGIWDKIRQLFQPSKRKIKSWYANENTEPLAPTSGVNGFVEWWKSVRNRIFRVAARVLVLVDIFMAILLYSNVWYMNLILYAYLVPSFLILLHYLRLTRNAPE